MQDALDMAYVVLADDATDIRPCATYSHSAGRWVQGIAWTDWRGNECWMSLTRLRQRFTSL